MTDSNDDDNRNFVTSEGARATAGRMQITLVANAVQSGKLDELKGALDFIGSDKVAGLLFDLDQLEPGVQHPLHSATLLARMDMVDALLDYRAQNRQIDISTGQPLRYPHISVNSKDGSGSTALHCAVRSSGISDRVDVLEHLLMRGADITVLNAAGQTPLEYAVTIGATAAVNFLSNAPVPVKQAEPEIIPAYPQPDIAKSARRFGTRYKL